MKSRTAGGLAKGLRPFKEATVLLLGAGDGALAERLAKRCKKVIGIENDPDKVKAARARMIPNATFFRYSPFVPFFYFKRFDVIVFSPSLLQQGLDAIQAAHNAFVGALSGVTSVAGKFAIASSSKITPGPFADPTFEPVEP